MKQGSGGWQLYYICRDYLGSITHLADSNGSLTQELSYGACSVKLAFCERRETKSIVELIPISEADREGRLRDPGNYTAYAPGSEPSLFLGRGYTGHEHLPWFGLVNMNGRLYDGAVGAFLSPDPYVQEPDLTLSYNRYSYCLNNPLKYTDPGGEKWKWPKFRWRHAIPIIGQLEYVMQAINDNTEKLREEMDKAGVPDFTIGGSVNSDGNVNFKGSYKGQEVLNTENVDRSDAVPKVNKAINDATRGRQAWYSIYNWPALGSSARTMDAIYAGDYLSATGNFLTCAAEVFTLGYGSTMSLGSKATSVAARSSTKLLNQFNSAESLISGAGKLTKVKAGMQGFVKGDGASIFKAISQGGTRQANGTVLMKDGTTLFNHFSTKTGIYTIDINKAGQVFKIRIKP